MAPTGNDVMDISANMLLVVNIETQFAAQIEVPISVAAKWQWILVQSSCVCFVIDECLQCSGAFFSEGSPLPCIFYNYNRSSLLLCRCHQ